MTKTLEFGPIDRNDLSVPYWLRWISAVDAIEPGVPPRWPADTRSEYLVPVESRAYEDVRTLEFLRERVRQVYFDLERVEPDAARVEKRAQEMLATGDDAVVHFQADDPMIPLPGGWQDAARAGRVYVVTDQDRREALALAAKDAKDAKDTQTRERMEQDRARVAEIRRMVDGKRR